VPTVIEVDSVALEGVEFAYARSARKFGPLEMSFRRGRLNAIVGPSGSGKSTVLGILGGLLRPSSGRVIARKSDGSRCAGRLEAAWVPQQSNALNARSVIDNVLVPARVSSGLNAASRQRAERALEMVGLGGFSQQMCRSLSGGERQRMCVARAVASSRPIVLADEPTGQLDERNSALVLDALQAVSEFALVVLVTHDVQAVRAAHHVIRMQDGLLHG
jgi:putative ABC transport system ATP-binding protein/lipoprotein-releasing system ATP-binding protein